MKTLAVPASRQSNLAFVPKNNRARSDEVCKNTPACEAARARLLAVPGDPFLKVTWEPSVFFHFSIKPELLRSVVPDIFELELHEGMACLSLAAVTMRQFRACRFCSPALFFHGMREQRFLNLRAYVKYRGEPGILFLHGWLSRPNALPLPSGVLQLAYTFAKLNYHHEDETLTGQVVARSSPSFCYVARLEAECAGRSCPAGSLAEFAMERYSGFFVRGVRPYVFRVWHPPWTQLPLRVERLDTRLITEKFPWFREATFAGANLTETIPEVWMGQAHRLPIPASSRPSSHRVLTGFYDMP